jgi:hypothetical protein
MNTPILMMTDTMRTAMFNYRQARTVTGMRMSR